jgi:hypothetical protein
MQDSRNFSDHFGSKDRSKRLSENSKLTFRNSKNE